MTIETGLRDKLAGTAAVSALVESRIYPLFVPQESPMPALAYQRISGRPTYSHDGDAGLGWARIQITCQAESYQEAKAVAAAVRTALTGASGVWDDTTVDAAFVENDRDGWADAREAPVVRLDVTVWYQE